MLYIENERKSSIYLIYKDSKQLKKIIKTVIRYFCLILLQHSRSLYEVLTSSPTQKKSYLS